MHLSMVLEHIEYKEALWIGLYGFINFEETLCNKWIAE